jgi:Domain of unknown function (DUF4157)
LDVQNDATHYQLRRTSVVAMNSALLQKKVPIPVASAKTPSPAVSPRWAAPVSKFRIPNLEPGTLNLEPRGSNLEPALGAAPSAKFSQVRLHPDAAEVTAPLEAKAVTRGQDVYFHPGQFQPGTPHGEGLIAHELAHTLQTRHAAGAGGGSGSFVSQPGDAFEQNADALVRGEATHALAAPAGAALRSPFPSETPAEQQRRETLIQSISNASNRLIRLLQDGDLMNFETATTRNGVRGVVNNGFGLSSTFMSYAERNTQIRRIIRFLQAMGTDFRKAPVPGDFSAPTFTPGSGGYVSTVQYPPGGQASGVGFPSAQPEWADLQAAYERHLISEGGSRFQSPYERDWMYLDPASMVVPGAAQGAPRLNTGIQTGVWVIIPDIEHNPSTTLELTGTWPRPPGSVIVELWIDQLGYYYMHRGQRIDVPNPHYRRGEHPP